jgi:hypothetical protein
LLGLISSLKQTLAITGDSQNLVVLRKGSGNDGSSQVSITAYQAIRFWDEIGRDDLDRPLVSPELVVQPLIRTRSGSRENVLVRGVGEMALAVHSSVRIGEGRMLRRSAGEAVVGRGILGRYAGTALGEYLDFGRRRWKVVGIIDDNGSSFESEVWVDVLELAQDSKRPWPYSGVRVRVASKADIPKLQRRIQEDPRFALEAQVETDYYAKQAESANSLYAIVVTIALLAGMGAGFGAANTMYAAVRARRVEIGTLRAIGFSRRTILVAFQIEALILAMMGFVLGVLLAFVGSFSVHFFFGSIGFKAQTFSTSVVTLRLTASDLARAFVLATFVGLASGIGPAWRAATLRPVEALRHT